MLEYVGIGGGLAFAAAVQPGPLQAYLFARVTAIGWRRTLPAALAPLLTDGPIALLALVVLGQLSSTVQAGLRIAGALLLGALAWRAVRQWRQDSPGPQSRADGSPRTLLEAALVNALNPNPYLGWALVLGPAVLAAWNEAPSAALALVLSFYATMVIVSALLIVAFGSVRLLGARLQRGLLLASGLVLASLAVYQLVAGIHTLVGETHPAATLLNLPVR